MAVAFDKMKILAADDNRTNLHILRVFLKKLGHEVILAENGAEAVQHFIDDRPDLVLLDIMMPVMDGFEAARQIKALALDKWTPIIFLSALNRDENLIEGLEAGADDYLTKPINFVVLEAKIRSMQRSLGMQQSALNALERLLAVSDNVIDAILTSDQNGRIVTVNRAAERIFGWPAERMIGQQISILLPDAAHLLASGPATASGTNEFQPVEREGTALRSNGQSFPVTVGVAEIQLHDERLISAIIRDDTERKQAERKLQENAALLQAYFDRTQSEQQLALRLMEKQLHRPGLDDPQLKYRVIATEHFSGDIVAAARSPQGRLYAMLADATGHGLSAAISVLPTLALFYQMSRLNLAVDEIVRELNSQLVESMPVGRFVAATILCLDPDGGVEIWLGGTPDALLVGPQGKTIQTIPSSNLPLGVTSDPAVFDHPVCLTPAPGSQIVLCSDGLLEATDEHDIQFGQDRLLAVLAEAAYEQRFAAIEEALAQHLGRRKASDDVSLMLINCV